MLSTRVRGTDTAAWRNTGVWFRNDQGRVRVISTRTIKPVRHKSPYLLPPITQRRNPSSRPEPRVLKLPSRKVYWLLLTCSCLSTSYTNTWSKHHTRVAKTITKVIVCPIVYEISQPASRHYRSHRLPPPIIRPYIIWLGGHVVGYWLLTGLVYPRPGRSNK